MLNSVLLARCLQSLENHIYKGLLHRIIDLELFKMHLFFIQTMSMSSTVFVIDKLNIIVE